MTKEGARHANKEAQAGRGRNVEVRTAATAHTRHEAPPSWALTQESQRLLLQHKQHAPGPEHNSPCTPLALQTSNHTAQHTRTLTPRPHDPSTNSAPCCFRT